MKLSFPAYFDLPTGETVFLVVGGLWYSKRYLRALSFSLPDVFHCLAHSFSSSALTESLA